MNGTEITMLTSMADRDDFCRALDNFCGWNLQLLDIKDRVWGKDLIDLSDDEAKKAAREISKRELRTYCLSSVLFHLPVEAGEEVFREHANAQLDRMIQLADVFQPKFIRLLSANLEKRDEIEDSVPYITENCPWLVDCYRFAIDRIVGAGFAATIENEARGNMFSTVDEILHFFKVLDTEKVSFTWDIQNLWTMGTFPDVTVFERLRPIIGYVHFKGGRIRESSESKALYWRAPLQDASWPVADICAAVVASGTSPVLCLNRSHGIAPDRYDRELEILQDLAYLKSEVGCAT